MLRPTKGAMLADDARMLPGGDQHPQLVTHVALCRHLYGHLGGAIVLRGHGVGAADRAVAPFATAARQAEADLDLLAMWALFEARLPAIWGSR